jgi:hypothetical protein
MKRELLSGFPPWEIPRLQPGEDVKPVIDIPDCAAGFGEERKAPSPLRRCDPQVRQAMAGGPLDWRLSRDGMTIELPAGSSEIKFGED